MEVTLSQVRNAQVLDRFVLLDFIRSIAIGLLLIAHIGQTIGYRFGGYFSRFHLSFCKMTNSGRS